MWIDIAVIAVIALFALIGFINGFIKTFLNFAGFFLSIIIASLLTGPVVALLQPTAIYTSIVGWIEGGFLSAITAIVSADMIFKAIVFVALLIASAIAFSIIKGIAKALKNLALINFVDKILGLALGLVFGLIAVYVVFYILSLLADVNFLVPVFDNLATSTIAKFFFEKNVIYMLINQFMTTGTINPDEILAAFN